MELSSEQQHVVDLALRGENVFFTGCAGTGKSFLLNHLISLLPPETTFVTSSTGMAAVLIGGTTVHSFAGVGLANDPLEVLISKVSRNRKVATRWRNCKVLIVDEVSMISAGLFDMLNHIARAVRRNEAPFGGIQV